MGPDRRSTARYITRRLDVTLTISGNVKSTGKLQDASLEGAFLYGLQPCPDRNQRNGKLSIQVPDSEKQIGREVEILRLDSFAGGCGVRFKDKLKNNQLPPLVDLERPVSTLSIQAVKQAATRDHSEIYQDVRGIQNCRSNIFMGTLVAIFTAAFTIATLSINQGKLEWTWILVASGIVFAFLTAGILVVIEKARAINCRNGYMAALERHVQRDTIPLTYPGWTQLLQCQKECGTTFRCEHKRADADQDSCVSIRKRESTWHRSKKVVPALLDSFTSLSAWIFSGLYSVISFVLVWASWTAADERWHSTKVSSAVTVGATLGIVALGIFLLTQLRNLRKGGHSYEAYYLAWMKTIRGCHCSSVMHDKIAGH